MGGRPRNSTKRNTPENASELARLLAEQWPDAVVELDHQNAYQLLVATILAAQSTDKMINTLTPALFEKYPDAHALAQANPAELEPMIFKSGFFRQKAKSLIAMAQALVERHGGEVPRTLDELVQVRGVGRKTANVVLGNALDVHEGIVVDTHVTRLAQRLGLTTNSDPVKIEQDLMEIVPRDQWTSFANRLIWHGRRVCHAKKPDHDHCILAPLCPSATLVQLPSTRRPSKRPPKAAEGTKIGKAAKAVKKVVKKAKPRSGR
ncbi:MAG: endonuclease III [Kofleriaceae bacterium]|nr:endonuclease III [Kofleriaceae bacterium]